MVKLEFKTTQLRNGMAFDYKRQLVEIVRVIPPLDPQGQQKRGFTDADMAQAEDLAAKIEASNGSIDLTAAEVMQLAEKVQNMQWPFSDQAFRQFVADITALRSQ